MRLKGPHFSFQDETPGSFVVVVVSFVGSGFSFKFLLFGFGGAGRLHGQRAEGRGW